MVEVDEAAVFPVVLYDGEREMDVGNIKIHSTLDFKQFQTMLSQVVGISYNNLTTYLVDNNKSKFSSERRKILITGKVNFSVLVRERNCYFFVVLKRSRRERRRKTNKQSVLEFSPVPAMSPGDFPPLRWNQTDVNDGQLYAYGSNYYDVLQMRKENYINTILFPKYEFNSPLNMNFPRIEEAYPTILSQRSRALCKECSTAQKQGKTAPFHLCVYDDVIEGGFRSPVGPISRPL